MNEILNTVFIIFIGLLFLFLLIIVYESLKKKANLKGSVERKQKKIRENE